MRLRRLAPIATIAVLIGLSACSSSSSKPSTSSTTSSSSTPTSAATSTTAPATTTTSPAPTTIPPTTVPVLTLGGPRILTLTGPPTPVQCNAPTSVQLHWETTGAKTVALSIDSGGVFATYGGGRMSKLVPLACDGKAHTYTFVARSSDGTAAIKSITITEHKT